MDEASRMLYESALETMFKLELQPDMDEFDIVFLPEASSAEQRKLVEVAVGNRDAVYI